MRSCGKLLRSSRPTARACPSLHPAWHRGGPEPSGSGLLPAGRGWPDLVTFWPSITCDLPFFPLTFLCMAGNPQRDLRGEPMTIGYLPWNRPAAADRVCMRDTNSELTYAEVALRVDAVAEQFAAAGVGRGDVVAVMLPNQVELLLGLMAAWRLGAAATPVNPVFTANEAGYQIADSGARLLLTAGPDARYGVPVLTPGELRTRPAEGRDARPREPGGDGRLDRRGDRARAGRQLPAGPPAVSRERHPGELPGP